MANVLVYLSLGSLEPVDCTCDQQRLWSDYADTQAYLSLCWSHKAYCRFCLVLADIFSCRNNKIINILRIKTEPYLGL